LTRVGLVGCGFISKIYAEKLNALPFVELVACADLREDRAKRLAEQHGVPRALGVDALLDTIWGSRVVGSAHGLFAVLAAISVVRDVGYLRRHPGPVG